jgi:ribosome-associated protein
MRAKPQAAANIGNVMFQVTDAIRIPDDELHWAFVRSGGPGGQNVNKVASKAVLHWNVIDSPHLPADVKARLRAQQHRRINEAGELVLTSQRFRDQGRNIEDCLEKLRAMIMQAVAVPRPRKRTRPSRGSREARLHEKRHRSTTKRIRRRPVDE